MALMRTVHNGSHMAADSLAASKWLHTAQLVRWAAPAGSWPCAPLAAAVCLGWRIELRELMHVVLRTMHLTYHGHVITHTKCSNITIPLAANSPPSRGAARASLTVRTCYLACCNGSQPSHDLGGGCSVHHLRVRILCAHRQVRLGPLGGS